MKKIKTIYYINFNFLFFSHFYYFYIKQLFTISSLSLAGDSEFYSGFIGIISLKYLLIYLKILMFILKIYLILKIIFLIFFVFYFLLFKYFNYRLIIIIFPPIYQFFIFKSNICKFSKSPYC